MWPISACYWPRFPFTFGAPGGVSLVAIHCLIIHSCSFFLFFTPPPPRPITEEANPFLFSFFQTLSTLFVLQASCSNPVETSFCLSDACAARAEGEKMAPASTDSPSQADTPMTDANDDAIPSVPVDAPTVSDPRFCSRCVPPPPHHHATFGRADRC